MYVLALVWVVFAVVQDLKTREVANWLNFSLIAFVLAYRGFYALASKDFMFFVYGLLGVLIFVVLGYVFYYGRVFAGGDAKLLMGLGGVFPYSSLMDYLFLGGGFVVLLFSAGVVWTLLFSLKLVGENRKKFGKEFGKTIRRNKPWIYFGVLLFVFLEVLVYVSLRDISLGLLGLVVLVFPFLFVYVKAVESACMIKLKKPGELTEGDWLERDVKVGRRTIRKSVHGLSRKDIALLKKARKKVWVKDGVPFTPAFLIAFAVIVVLLFIF